MRANSDLASDAGAGTGGADGDLQQPCSSGGSPSQVDSGETQTNISTTSNANRTTAAALTATSNKTQSSQSRSKTMLQILPYGRRVAPWPHQGLVEQMLRFYADNGDVQMAACVLLVLGEKSRFLVDDNTQKMWFSAYIGMRFFLIFFCFGRKIFF